MNACAMAMGMHSGQNTSGDKNGRETARETLHDFWHRIHKSGLQYNPMQATPWQNMMGFGGDNTFGHFMMDSLSRMFSPYQFNPFDVNPLRDVLSDMIDFKALRKGSDMKLFISATNVKTGKVRIFKTHELTLDVVLSLIHISEPTRPY